MIMKRRRTMEISGGTVGLNKNRAVLTPLISLNSLIIRRTRNTVGTVSTNHEALSRTIVMISKYKQTVL